ncbi:MarR family transcriptional regulator [Treponema sp. HNW]|uniref:MarR family winged helix-turn-helix transcriptional regulator n=1 Tax=Treponema sp. HNW TaxID=3116654 RepID=UPI003D1398EE
MEEDLNNISSLVSKISSNISSYLNRSLAERGFAGIASSHGYIVYLLAKNGKMKMGDLARCIHKDKSTATALIKKLEREGYIRRERSETDNRITFVSLTEKGSAYTQAASEISRTLIDTCYKGFSEEEKQTLFSLLCKVEENFS